MVCDDKESLPEVGIYVGYGASHSWTWFADIFDRAGYDAVCFLDEKDIAAGALNRCDAFFVSGGDTFAIAEGLGQRGAEEIERFVGNGGTYIGACAGAYLPLKSSLTPLNKFNYVGARIANLSKNLPVPQQMAEKFCTEYGCRYVFHPVREEVVVKLKDRQGTIKAPLYGGPAMLPSDDIEVLAEYEGFTGKTEFLIDREIAGATLIGNVAAARKKSGRGVYYLFGPHFEHPEYPEANEILFNILSESGRAGREERTMGHGEAPGCAALAAKNEFTAFLSEISNSRIMALALERTSYTWLIGKKVYDPEKIRVFIEAIWSRARRVDPAEGYAYVSDREMKSLQRLAGETTGLLRQLRAAEGSADSDMIAQQLFTCLRDVTARFLSLYFNLKRDGVLEHEGRLTCTTITCISPQPRHCIPCR